MIQIRHDRHGGRNGGHSWRSSCALVWLIAGIMPGILQADLIIPPDGWTRESASTSELWLDASRRYRGDAWRDSARLTVPLPNSHLTFFLDGQSTQERVDDLAVVGTVDFSGGGRGGGLYYTDVPDVLGMKSTLRLAYHREETDSDDRLAVGGRQAQVERDLISPSIGLLLNPAGPMLDNGLSGYLVLGLSRVRQKQTTRIDGVADSRLSDRETRAVGHVEAGLVYPWWRLRFFTVLSVAERVSLSAGVRVGVGRQFAKY